MKNRHDGGNKTARILAKMLREMLDCREYALIADLLEDVKVRATACRVRWTPSDLADALALVESNRPLVTLPHRPKGGSAPVRPALELVRGDEARSLIAELYRRNPDAKKPWG